MTIVRYAAAAAFLVIALCFHLNADIHKRKSQILSGIPTEKEEVVIDRDYARFEACRWAERFWLLATVMVIFGHV